MMPVFSVKSFMICVSPGSWLESQMVTDSVTSELSELSVESVDSASDDELSDELLELPPPHAAMDSAIVPASKSAIAFLNFIYFSSL